MLTNPRDAFRGQQGSPRSTIWSAFSLVTQHEYHSTIPYVRYSFLLCNAVVTLSLRRAVFPIFDFKKWRDLEIRVSGHSRSLKMVPFDRLRMISY